jgi:hypothetical protein
MVKLFSTDCITRFTRRNGKQKVGLRVKLSA